MQLTYRGVRYEYHSPAVDLPFAYRAGRYRGVDWQSCIPAHHTDQFLTFEGVERSKEARGVIPQGKSLANGTDVVVANGIGRIDRSRALLSRHQRSIKTRQQAMLTRLAIQVGLPAKNAATYWNRIQGKIHPSFRSTYDRSGAAMS